MRRSVGKAAKGAKALYKTKSLRRKQKKTKAQKRRKAIRAGGPVGSYFKAMAKKKGKGYL